MWVGPIDETFPNAEAEVKKWLSDQIDNKAQMDGAVKTLEKIRRVEVWSTEIAEDSMRNAHAASDAEYKTLNNGFAIVVFNSAEDLDAAHIAYSHAETTLLAKIETGEVQWPPWFKFKDKRGKKLKVEPLLEYMAPLMTCETKKRIGDPVSSSRNLSVNGSTGEL